MNDPYDNKIWNANIHKWRERIGFAKHSNPFFSPVTTKHALGAEGAEGARKYMEKYGKNVGQAKACCIVQYAKDQGYNEFAATIEVLFLNYHRLQKLKKINAD